MRAEMRAEMRALPILALAALLLAGCGQKGPRYLPADAATASDEMNDAATAPANAAPEAPDDES